MPRLFWKRRQATVIAALAMSFLQRALSIWAILRFLLEQGVARIDWRQRCGFQTEPICFVQ
ncbi:MAG: hypothetical protein ABS35_00545 [Kaistia sp. SCN 65-12]|nr:MAG: hypothetical protein ABS35_00545 [Kaistia sp. SCN 65-12]